MESSNSESEEETNLSESETQNVEEKQEVPEYERQRQLRIQENNKRMEALGLSKIASSFKSSAEKANKKKNDKTGKKKKADEDEEYNPIEDDDDEEKGVSSEEEKKDSDFIVSGKKKVKRNTPIPKKRGPNKKLKFDSDYVDDDEAMLQAIALSLGFSDVKSGSAQSSAPHIKKNTNSKASGSCNADMRNDDSGKKRKKPVTSRVQMSEDEIILHYFQFDEADKGGISVRDIERLAIAHDFTWSDKEMHDMIYCLDSNGDGKISLDDFRKIVSRVNMVKSSDIDTTG